MLKNFLYRLQFCIKIDEMDIVTEGIVTNF